MHLSAHCTVQAVRPSEIHHFLERMAQSVRITARKKWWWKSATVHVLFLRFPVVCTAQTFSRQWCWISKKAPVLLNTWLLKATKQQRQLCWCTDVCSKVFRPLDGKNFPLLVTSSKSKVAMVKWQRSNRVTSDWPLQLSISHSSNCYWHEGSIRGLEVKGKVLCFNLFKIETFTRWPVNESAGIRDGWLPACLPGNQYNNRHWKWDREGTAKGVRQS